MEHHPDHEDGWTILYQEQQLATLVFTGRAIEGVGLLFSFAEDSRAQEKLLRLCQLGLVREASFQNNRTKEVVSGIHFPLTLIDDLVALRDQRPVQSPVSRAITEIGEFCNLGHGVISSALLLAILVFNFSDWLFGRTVRYEFSRIPSSHLSRSDFEEEFTRRVIASGYQVFNFRVTYENQGMFDAWITLKNVPSSIDDRQAEADLRRVRDSFSNKPVELERR